MPSFTSVGKTAAVSVGSAAPVEITAALKSPAARGSIHFMNLGPDPIYYGFDNGVTPATGMQLVSGRDVNYDGQMRIWAICAAAGAADVRVAEVG